MTNTELQKVEKILSISFTQDETAVLMQSLTNEDSMDNFLKKLESCDVKVQVIPTDAPIIFEYQGKAKYISRDDATIITALKRFPFSVIREIFEISEYDLKTEMERIEEAHRKRFVEILSKRWIDRHSGEDVVFSADLNQILVGSRRTAKWLIENVSRLKIANIHAFNSFFEDDREYSEKYD